MAAAMLRLGPRGPVDGDMVNVSPPLTPPPPPPPILSRLAGYDPQAGDSTVADLAAVLPAAKMSEWKDDTDCDRTMLARFVSEWFLSPSPMPPADPVPLPPPPPPLPLPPPISPPPSRPPPFVEPTILPLPL